MSQTINVYYMTINTTGSAGNATGSATTNVRGGISGFLYSVVVKPNTSGWASTTDITFTEAEAPGRALLTLTNKNSALASYPVRIAEAGTDGAALSTYAPFALAGSQITVSLAQANAQTPALEVWFYVLR